MITISQSETSRRGEDRWQRLEKNLIQCANQCHANQFEQKYRDHPPGPAPLRPLDRQPRDAKRESRDEEILPVISHQFANIAVAHDKIGDGKFSAKQNSIGLKRAKDSRNQEADNEGDN